MGRRTLRLAAVTHPGAHFIPRGRWVYLPPFRIVHKRVLRGDSAPLWVMDARNWPVGKFTRWAYAWACLQALCERYNEPEPEESAERWRYNRSIRSAH